MQMGIFSPCQSVAELFGLPDYRVPSFRDSTVLVTLEWWKVMSWKLAPEPIWKYVPKVDFNLCLQLFMIFFNYFNFYIDSKISCYSSLGQKIMQFRKIIIWLNSLDWRKMKKKRPHKPLQKKISLKNYINLPNFSENVGISEKANSLF